MKLPAFGRRLGLALYLLFALFPLYWLLKIAVTPTRELYRNGSALWPQTTTFEHFAKVWQVTQFPDYFWNSARVSLGAALLATLAALLAGYALSRCHFRGKKLVAFVLLLTQMFSVMLMIVPLNKLLNGAGLADSLFGLAVVYAALNVPFATFLMQSFIDAIPRELEEAAMLDGCNRWQAMHKVVLPLTVPGIAATAGFAFTAAWSELFLGLVLMHGEASKTFPPALLSFITKFNVDWGQMTAAAVLALLPVCVFFAFIQRYLVAGLTSGAVKG